MGRSSRAGAAAGHFRAAVARTLELARPASNAQRALVLALLIADLAVMAGFVAFAYAEHYGIQNSPFYGRLEFSFVDGGYPERYGYGKQVLIALLLLGAHRVSRQTVYLGFALLFAVSVFDDAFAVHEALGDQFAASTGIPLLLAGPIVWAAMGLVPLLAIVAGYFRSDERARADAAAVLLGFAILLAFAVGVDLLHGILSRYVTGFQTVMTLAEDGGELLTLTLIAMVSLGIYQRRRGGHPA